MYQRKRKGGQPIIIIKNDKYYVEDLTQSVVSVPWGCEVVWCCLTPKDANSLSKIQKIICACVYSKPDSRFKSKLLDHISDTYNLLSAKFKSGLHWLIAGDTNELKLDAILNLDSRMVQVVQDRTRLRSKPPGILDPIITTLSQYYQRPVCLPPLKSDSHKSESDHLMVLMSPITSINNESSQTQRFVQFRRYTQKNLDLFEKNLQLIDWSCFYNAENSHQKAEIMQDLILGVLNKCIPEQKVKFSNRDREYFTTELKTLDRKRKRVYSRHGRNNKWKYLNNKFKEKLSQNKKSFYSKMIKDLKNSNPRLWYSKLKRMMCYDDKITGNIQVSDISHFTSIEQANMLADHFSSISREYDPLLNNDIEYPEISEGSFQKFQVCDIIPYLSQIKTNKSNLKGDIPAKIIKQYARSIAEPFTHLLNTMVQRGEYPDLWKMEIQTPVPKVHPPQKISQMRNISGLLNFDKIAQKILGEIVTLDMKEQMDPAQYGNQKKTSTQHYLINFLHSILTKLEPEKNEKLAVIASFIDWKDAFPRMSHKLGVEAFIKMGVRPSLIPMLANFFQNRKMVVKWHGKYSEIKKLNGSGPQGATLGLLEYLGLSNDNADFVNVENKFKFIDDLSLLELINLLTVGISSYNFKQHIPSDVPETNCFIEGKNLKTQEYVEKLVKWTNEKQMKLNNEKSNIMIFNPSKKIEFSTRIEMEGKILPIVKDAKILGVVISDDFTWNANTKFITKKANSRLVLLRKAKEYTDDKEDLKQIYTSYIRSILEYGCAIWHSSLTDENRSDIERVQKNSFRIILGHEYEDYLTSLIKLNMNTLEDRRIMLNKKFAEQCVENPKTKMHFIKNSKTHEMKTRYQEKFKVTKAKRKRLQKSSIIYFQKKMNESNMKKIRTGPKT